MTMTMDQRATTVWVPIENVIPNPLNPRKNDAVRSEEMSKIIQERGWEEPLTVYKKGKYYVVLAGHRRLHSAKEVGIKELPVFIVETPTDPQEEIERIASLQKGRVDWTPYEWAQFTYKRWVAWGRPAVTQFAKDIGLPQSNVRSYVNVLSYYPRHEIEAELQSEVYSISSLDVLANWIGKAKQYKPHIVEDMSEDLIRKIMLNKLSNNLINRDSLRSDTFIAVSSDKDFKEFLTSTTMKLIEAQEIYGVEAKKKSFRGHVTSMGQMTVSIGEMKPSNADEKESALKNIQKLRNALNKKSREIKAMTFE